MKVLCIVFFEAVLCNECLTVVNNCDDENPCNNDKPCLSIEQFPSIEQFNNLVGPTDVFHKTLCNCGIGNTGWDCSGPKPFTASAQCTEQLCENNGTTNWIENIVSGCNCRSSNHHYGWYCEHENEELCLLSEIEMTESALSWLTDRETFCGQCKNDAECQDATGNSKSICVRKQNDDGRPANYCKTQCSKTADCGVGENNVCLVDENQEQVCTCKHGWEGPGCSEKAACEDRCLNGAVCEDPNSTVEDCNCGPMFDGLYCEKPSICHPAVCEGLLNQKECSEACGVSDPDSEDNESAPAKAEKCSLLFVSLLIMLNLIFKL